jgi:protein-S-isoprenylcysteine O-methyltransferase Ste14
LDHKIPPPIVGAFLAGAMWVVARMLSVSQISEPVLKTSENLRIAVALAFVALGIFLMALGVLAFRRAKTTTSAVRPQTVSSLVTRSVYRYTRNPMYLGDAIVLVGFAVYLAAPLAFFGPVVFILFVTRFQISPEERALRERFGREFLEYQEKVRRWI